MIIRNFEYLLALNQEKHFARAAAACRVSQPTLSAGIKQLEEDMDVRIVKRGQRFEGFTREGERVLAWAQQMMDDCSRLKQELSELRDTGMQGPFRLGMLPATSALASLLTVTFAERFPALQISMETADPERLLKLLRQGEMDVALMHLDQPAGEGLDVYALYRERMFLFTTSEVGNGRRVSWNEVVALPLCLLRSAVPRTAELQLEKAAKVIHTDSPAVLAAHVASGRWSTVLPQSLVGTLTQNARPPRHRHRQAQRAGQRRLRHRQERSPARRRARPDGDGPRPRPGRLHPRHARRPRGAPPAHPPQAHPNRPVAIAVLLEAT